MMDFIPTSVYTAGNDTQTCFKSKCWSDYYLLLYKQGTYSLCHHCCYSSCSVWCDTCSSFSCISNRKILNFTFLGIIFMVILMLPLLFFWRSFTAATETVLMEGETWWALHHSIFSTYFLRVCLSYWKVSGLNVIFFGPGICCLSSLGNAKWLIWTTLTLMPWYLLYWHSTHFSSILVASNTEHFNIYMWSLLGSSLFPLSIVYVNLPPHICPMKAREISSHASRIIC